MLKKLSFVFTLSIIVMIVILRESQVRILSSEPIPSSSTLPSLTTPPLTTPPLTTPPLKTPLTTPPLKTPLTTPPLTTPPLKTPKIIPLDLLMQQVNEAIRFVNPDPVLFRECPKLSVEKRELYDRVIPTDSKIFFAGNTFESEKILPTQMLALAEVFHYLGGGKRIGLSLHETGSRDSYTKKYLHIFPNLTEALGIKDVNIYTGEERIDWDRVHRIQRLSELRNAALVPLFETHDWDLIYFFNDAYFCATDALEMIYQHYHQTAHMTCSLDWNSAGKGDGLFYDSWVSRDIGGKTFGFQPTDKEMLYNHLESKKRWEERIPFQVFSCWNGMAILDTKPFFENNVRFRRSDKASRECSTSECYLICVDFWKAGYGKIQVVPVLVAYELRDMEYVRSHYTKAEKPTLNETITWVGPPKQVQCSSWPEQFGKYLGMAEHYDANPFTGQRL